MKPGGHTTDEEQAKYLDEARRVVKQQAFYMKRATDKSDLREALKHASNMLCELRTSLLSPQNYYELYMMVVDELRFLEMFFGEVSRTSKPLVELYEMVQHAGNVLPRLYLLVTVGSVYIKSKEVPARDILKDLVEMCKGVQHPIRGLFLRHYLSSLTKDKLPDIGSEYEGHGGTVEDAVEFVLQNFAEVNRLWVRMQHQGRVRDRAFREQQRLRLRSVVGTNLMRMSQLEGVTLDVYKRTVLPRVLEQVLECKDKIAQEYLMDCVIQAFSDTFHLATLDELLEATMQLRDDVNVRGILVGLMRKLATFAEGQAREAGGERDAAAPLLDESLRAFEKFNEYAAKLIDKKPDYETSETLELQEALLQFATRCFPARSDYVNAVLGFCADLLQRSLGSGATTDESSTPVVVTLLSAPLRSQGLGVLKLDKYPLLMAHLPWRARRDVSMRLLTSTLAGGDAAAAEVLSAPESVDRLLSFVRPLVVDAPDSPYDESRDKEEFEAEQRLVARVVNLLHNDDTDVLYQVYRTARGHFGDGGVYRILFTLTSLVFAALRLAPRVRKREQAGEAVATKTRKVFQFVYEMVTVLASRHAERALQLFLQSARAADALGETNIAYEFISKACTLYEDIADSRQQIRALHQLVGTLHGCRSFETETHETLAKRVSQYGAKLLKKGDQARMVLQSAHLFWVEGGADGEGRRTNPVFVLECLKRSVKIAKATMEAGERSLLFLHILNKYLFFFERGNPKITPDFITGLVELVAHELELVDEPSMGSSTVSRETLETYFEGTLRHIRAQKAASGGAADKFADVRLPPSS